MICIYHSRDLDGWMSAAIVKLWNPKVELIGWDYGQPVPDLAFKEVVLVDVTLPTMFMVDNANRITWIDHHFSAIKQMSELDPLPFFNGLRNDKFAACELTWKFFFPEQEMPEIVRLLGRYDCFGHKGTDEERSVLEFQYAARTYMTTPNDCLDYLMADIGEISYNDEILDVDQLMIIGGGIYEYICTEAQQTYKRAFPVIFLIHEDSSHDTAYQFLCVNQERFNPINFGINYHADKHNGFLCFHYANGKWNFSLYNDDGEVDCSTICKMLGGGGHKGASGFIAGDEFVVKLISQRRIDLTPLK